MLARQGPKSYISKSVTPRGPKVNMKQLSQPFHVCSVISEGRYSMGKIYYYFY